MDDKRLRKISKKELLEILLAQAQKIEELEAELLIVKDELNSKKITIVESGSIAEASLRLNKIFEVAQKSVDQYKYNVEKKCQAIEAETEERCRKLKEEAEACYAKSKKKTKSKVVNDSKVKDNVKKINSRKKNMSVKSKNKK